VLDVDWRLLETSIFMPIRPAAVRPSSCDIVGRATMSAQSSISEAGEVARVFGVPGAVLMGLALIVIGLVWHRIAGSTAGARTPG